VSDESSSLPCLISFSLTVVKVRMAEQTGNLAFIDVDGVPETVLSVC